MEYFRHTKHIEDTIDLYIRSTKKDTRIIVHISLCIMYVTYEKIRISLRKLYECYTITYKKHIASCIRHRHIDSHFMGTMFYCYFLLALQ